MSKHTPGPWGAAARQGDDWESVVYVPGTPNEICQCFHTSMSLGGKEKCEANARLIAAAPEMYAKLDKIVTWLEGNARRRREHAKNCRDFQSIAHEYLAEAKNYDATAKDIRKLLAKAEGRERA